MLENTLEEFLSQMKSTLADFNAQFMDELTITIKKDMSMIMEDWLRRSMSSSSKPGEPLVQSAQLPIPCAAESPPPSLPHAPSPVLKGFAAWAPPPPIEVSPQVRLGQQVGSGSQYSPRSSTIGIIPNQVGVHELNDAKLSRQNSMSSKASKISSTSRRAMHRDRNESMSTKMSEEIGAGAVSVQRELGERRDSDVSEMSEQSQARLTTLRKQLSLKRMSSRRSVSSKRSGRSGRSGGRRSVVEEEENEDASSSDSDDWLASTESTSLYYKKFQSCVRSWQFEFAATFVIFSDLVVMGLRTNYAAVELNIVAPLELVVFQRLLVPLFIAELLMRVACERESFFCDRQQLGWNCFDCLIVVGSLLETSLDIESSVTEGTQTSALGGLGFRMIRIVRILRLTRMLRVARIIRFITPLRTLVTCITSTLKSLAWSLVLLGIIIYGTAIMFTDICTDYRITNLGGTTGSAEYLQIAETTFGHLPMGILTLLGVISNGKDWVEVATMIFGVDLLFGFVFCLYIAFAVFAVLNVMTGVFCQAAIESAQRDQDLMTENMLSIRARDVENLRALFQSMDTNGDGMLDLLELEECFDNQQAKTLFASLDIHLENAWQLFNLLDSEGEGQVNASDFVDLCFKVKGQAKTVDIACLTKQSKVQSKRIRQKLLDMEKHMKEQDKMIGEILITVSSTPTGNQHTDK
eukprot:TRINITY_DN13246_c1_g1_i1.p1 TRINITY_DN13246_c1_g1~~TRINITY_DN13246_c1_g1_i1.p1  ORF type:complete len:714 (+),score=113.73 TRINITY_DN13246_c1_g1_i1:64-2142(+)